MGYFFVFCLGSFNIWPSKQQINEKMPQSFKCYSSYKSSYTWKGLVGIAPHGALTFVFSLFTGSMSDVDITKLSGLLDRLEEGPLVKVRK